VEILTPKTARRSTRLRVEISLTVTSMDRRHAFCATCVALVVSPQGCGLRTTQALPIKTPVLLSDLPGGGSASAHVMNCLPLGSDGKYFLVGVSLYNHGNIWGITNPPEDWNCPPNAAAHSTGTSQSVADNSKNVWPYNLFSSQGEADRGRK
jgi:hypothetical protein